MQHVSLSTETNNVRASKRTTPLLTMRVLVIFCLLSAATLICLLVIRAAQKPDPTSNFNPIQLPLQQFSQGSAQTNGTIPIISAQDAPNSQGNMLTNTDQAGGAPTQTKPQPSSQQGSQSSSQLQNGVNLQAAGTL